MSDYDTAVDAVLRAADGACGGDRPKMFAALVGAFGKFASDAKDPSGVVQALERCIRVARRAHAAGVAPGDGEALTAILDQETGP